MINGRLLRSGAAFLICIGKEPESAAHVGSYLQETASPDRAANPACLSERGGGKKKVTLVLLQRIARTLKEMH